LILGYWDIGILGFGIWDLGFGIWDLGFGIWDLGFGIWDRPLYLIISTFLEIVLMSR